MSIPTFHSFHAACDRTGIANGTLGIVDHIVLTVQGAKLLGSAWHSYWTVICSKLFHYFFLLGWWMVFTFGSWLSRLMVCSWLVRGLMKWLMLGWWLVHDCFSAWLRPWAPITPTLCRLHPLLHYPISKIANLQSPHGHTGPKAWVLWWTPQNSG